MSLWQALSRRFHAVAAVKGGRAKWEVQGFIRYVLPECVCISAFFY